MEIVLFVLQGFSIGDALPRGGFLRDDPREVSEIFKKVPVARKIVAGPWVYLLPVDLSRT
jgi:hypothetical protein